MRAAPYTREPEQATVAPVKTTFMRDAADDFRLAILAMLGNAPEVITPGRFHRFRTSRRSGDTAGWCQLFEDGRAGVFGDFRSDLSSVWSARRREQMTHAERADIAQRLAHAKAQRDVEQRAERKVNAKRNSMLWSNTVPVSEGDPVWLYLRRRGLCGLVPDQLRLHPRLTYWDGGDRGNYPAMVAPLIGVDGQMLALHRTYLSVDGCKAPVPTVKKLTGAAGPLAGACIPLHTAQHNVIGIAEGIETAHAAHLASGLPTVAAYCAGNLAAYIWPPGIKRIVVFADGDLAGRAAAQRLKARATRAGVNVAVMTPTTPGADWCDVWAQRVAGIVNSTEVAA
jgi:putative DNA primase/helicase